MDDVVADFKVMEIKQWMEKTKDRERWRMVVEEAKEAPKGRIDRCFFHTWCLQDKF